MKSEIEWTDDCSGKKDYDGDIVAVSTRYWPKRYQDNGKVSATSSIMLSDGCPDHNGETEDLISKDFEGDTFAEVAIQVQGWVQEQMDRVEKALRAEFGPHK